MAVAARSAVFALNLRFKHHNATAVEEFLKGAEPVFGKKDLAEPIETLQKHWVKTVADLRLLFQEGELRNISLPMRLCVWIEEELSQHADGQVQIMAPRGDLHFNYMYDFDTNGLFYYLATQGGTMDWQNPADTGSIKVASSGLLADSVPLEAIAGRQAVRCVTNAHPNSWISVDLVDKWLVPSHYTVRHYSSWDTEALRSWRLEGSNDGLNWVLLRDHDNDDSLQRQGQSHTWEIARSPETECGFRIFRLKMTKPNSNNHMYLACSGLEFYGSVSTAPPSADSQRRPGGAAGAVGVGGAAGAAGVAPSAASAVVVAAAGGRREFVHRKPFDGEGLIHFLATADSTRPYSNPADAGLVSVTASSLMPDSEPLSAVVGNKVVRCVTRPQPNSWIRVDLLARKLCPTAYSLRHYSSWDMEALRSWRFEGSNDGINWTTLREHVDDQTLDKKGAIATFPLPEEFHSTPFQMFRVFQTGLNSNKHYYLALSGFELYGRLVEAAGARDGRTFVYHHDFDGNGIIDYIGTAEGTKPWTNPAEAGLVRVSASSLMPDSTPASAVVGHEVVRCCTKPQAKSWFAVDLLSYMVHPTHYTLRHYASWDVEALRNWDLEGSNDGVTWTLLRHHENDVGLHSRGGTFTWPLPSVNQPFRIFRLLQWGVNSNKHNYLALSGFEIYGSLTKLAPVSAASASRIDVSQLQWDSTPSMISQFLDVTEGGKLVTNRGSADKWQLVRTRQTFSLGVVRVAIRIDRDVETSNTWRFIVGVIPQSFPPPPHADIKGKEWVGAHDSWGYIGGTGGKCHQVAKSFPYGETFQQGDVVAAEVNFEKQTLEFFKNGQSQKVAFTNVVGPVHLAVSFTGRGTAIRIVDEAAPLGDALAAGGGMGDASGGAGSAHWWDPSQRAKNLTTEGAVVFNRGSNDKWQTVRSACSFSEGQHRFTIEILESPATPNNYKFIVGVVPPSFPLTWVGAAESWGYIGGTGGKCFNVGSSTPYGSSYGAVGDRITVSLDFTKSTIEFSLNGKSQGVAFTNLTGTVYAAVSMTATNAKVRLVDVV